MPGRIGRFLLLTAILLVIFVGVHGVLAQAAFTATLSPPDTSEFPHLLTYLDVHDPSGAFVHQLDPADVTLQENGVQVLPGELQEQKPGVQFVIAISPGESFAIRDGQGTSRYEVLLQGLLAGTWAAQPSGIDDFSLITTGGPQLIHSSDADYLYSLLEKYRPEDTQANPGLEALASALQVSSETPVRPGMEKAILFITPPQDQEVSLGLQSIISTANQQNIRIFVWLLAAQEIFNLPEADLLRNLADQTQAAFFTFSHDEPVPDLESILEPLRYVYQLGYDSQVANAGAQQLVAQVMVGSEQVITQPVSFDLDLQAPAPAFLSLPDEITRTFASQPTPGADSIDTSLLPLQQVIKIQVTFPDGHDRPITRTSLYVDAVPVAENLAEPFDQFIWDLRPFTQDSVHILNVEAVDSLGMVGNSGETSISITVPDTTQGVMVVFSQKRQLLVGVIVLISASVLVLVLILGGRIHPKRHPGQVRASAGSGEKTQPGGFRERKRRLKDPVTQPVTIASAPAWQTGSRLRILRDRLPWFKKKIESPPAIAHLVPLTGSDEPTLSAPMQITADDVTLGRDPARASLVIPDASIEGLHARIQHQGKSFLIIDAGSVAGTWVNYEPVPPEGTRLAHADIIHLGGVGFRFTIVEPSTPRKIVITPLEPDQ